MIGSLTRAPRDRESLAAFLPHDSFDPSGSVFVGRDRSLGLAWCVEFPQAEILDDDGFAKISTRFSELMRTFPPGSVVQWILFSDRDVTDELSHWTGRNEGAKRTDSCRDLLSQHARMLARLHLDDKGRPFVTRKLRSYLTVRTLASISGSAEEIGNKYRTEKAKLLSVASRIEGAFLETGLGCHRLDAPELKKLLFKILNPGSTHRPTPYRPDLPMRHQVIRTPATVDWSTGNLSLGGVCHRVLSMTETPAETYPGELLFPKSGASLTRLIPDSMTVLNIEILDDYRTRRKLEKKNSFVQNQLMNPKAKHDIRAIGSDVDAAIQELMTGGSMVRVRLHVVVRDSSEAATRDKSGAAKRVLQDMGMVVVEEEDLALSIFLQTLPLSYDPSFDKGMKRSCPILTSNLADLGPSYSSFQGTPTPDLLFQNRRGEPITFSLFDSNDNFNCLVTGTSGAGKSYWTNYAITSHLAQDAIVFAIDRGNSYHRLTRLVGGRYVTLDDPSRPVRINFVGRASDFDETRLLLVKDLLSEMATQGREPLLTHQASALEEAVISAVDKKRGSPDDEVFLSDIHAALGALAGKANQDDVTLGAELYRLALAMKPFVGKGAYAKYFDGPSTVEFGEGLTVFELGDIATRKEVATVLVMVLLHVIGDFAGAEKYLARKKLVVIDEAWTLLESEATASFLKNAFKTYRKYNTGAMVVTQQVSDFSGPAAQAIVANATNRVFLRQKSEAIQAMARDLDLDPQKKAAIGSLRTAKGKFSEFLIESSDTCGVARLAANPHFYWLATSDGKDKAYLANLEEVHRAGGASNPLREAMMEAAAHGTGRKDSLSVPTNQQQTAAPERSRL